MKIKNNGTLIIHSCYFNRIHSRVNYIVDNFNVKDFETFKNFNEIIIFISTLVQIQNIRDSLKT